MARERLRRDSHFGFAAALLCACGNFTATLAADADTAPPQQAVRIADLNLSDPRGVAAAYNRIRWAAERVCPFADSGDHWLRVSAQPCIAQAISAAVESIGSRQLKTYAQTQWPFRLQRMRTLKAAEPDHSTPKNMYEP